MRQLLGTKKTNALREKTGLPIVRVMVRGNTDHRMDLCLKNGTITYLYRNGQIEKSDHLRSGAINHESH